MKPPKGNGNKFTETQRFKVVALYKLLGSQDLVSQNTGISISTIKNWKSQDWWKEMEYELTQTDRIQTSVSLQKIRDKAISEVMDRLESGDYIYDMKTGEIKRKPINAAVVNKILQDSIDKSVLITKLNQQDKLVSSNEKVVDRLQLIADRLMNMARQSPLKPLGEVLEGELYNHPNWRF